MTVSRLRAWHASTVGLFVAFLSTGGANAVEPAGVCDPDRVEWSVRASEVTIRGNIQCTLSDLSRMVPEEALERVGPGAVWYLKVGLVLQEGARLEVQGTDVGGDVDELRLRSNTHQWASIIADWGIVKIVSTRVLSWSDELQGPDSDPTQPRPFLSARSFMDDDVPRESTMTLVDSEVSHLGYAQGQSYGLSWKAGGTGPSGSNSPLFQRLKVYGHVERCHIHHNYMGIYTWGAYQMRMVDNHIHDNVLYGIDPHDNSRQLLIQGNETYHNGRHGIICSKHCSELTIINNHSHHNGGHGIMLHMFVTDSRVEGNLVESNGESGIAIFNSHGNVIRDNLSVGNRFGIRAYQGSENNLVEHNTVEGNEGVGIYFAPGGGEPPRDNRVVLNVIVNNGSSGVRKGVAEEQEWENNLVDGRCAGGSECVNAGARTEPPGMTRVRVDPSWIRGPWFHPWLLMQDRY